MRGLAVALGSVLALASPARGRAQACVTPAVGRVPFGLGERLSYDIDSLGASIGTLRLAVLPGQRGAAYAIEARGRTNTFAANFYQVDAIARSHLGPALQDRSYSQDATERGVRESLDIAFPAAQGRLHVRAAKEGNRHDFDLHAPDQTRDLLAALYTLRAMKLTDGEELCLPVYGAKHVWFVRARVAGREMAHTPAGDFRSIHLTGSAVFVDNPKVCRPLQFWLTDDARRLPVAACGTVQNKPVCANLESFVVGKRWRSR